MTALQVVESRVFNPEAEMAVVASMLLDSRASEAVTEIVRPDDFSDPFLGFVFATIAREHALGNALSSITLRPLIDKEPAYNEIGGWNWLSALVESAVPLLSAKESARQVVEFARRRRLIEGLRDSIALAGDFEQSVDSVIQSADDALSIVKDNGEARGEYSAAECLKALIDDFDTPVSGVECGIIPSIDRLLGPLRPGHLVIGAGRPGMGKTATAISYALGASYHGHATLFVSLEMAAQELAERMAADMCQRSEIAYERIRDRKLNDEQKREVCRAYSRLENMPLQIVDRSGLTAQHLRAIVRRWVRRFNARGQKLELVIVDYLQLMAGAKGQDRYAAITDISIALKQIAKEHGLAILALSQLNRSVEQRGDKRPTLSDLRESGQIEQDADAVLFFLRDEYYLRLAEPPVSDPKRPKWEQLLRDCAQKIEFICAKRRNGATGSATGDFFYHYQAVRG